MIRDTLHTNIELSDFAPYQRAPQVRSVSEVFRGTVMNDNDLIIQVIILSFSVI